MSVLPSNYPGHSFMKLGNLGGILKICISRKIFPFNRGTKYILEHLFDLVNQSNLVSFLFIQF